LGGYSAGVWRREKKVEKEERRAEREKSSQEWYLVNKKQLK